MNNRFLTCLAGAALCVTAAVPTTSAQDRDQLPVWAPDKNIVTKLGEEFSDARFSIRPPSEFELAESADPNASDRGVWRYGWMQKGTPTMALTVVLTPSKQSTATLDKTFGEFRSYMLTQMADAKFGEIRRGRFNGVEARAGEYTGIQNGKELTTLYLCGIDSKGMFWLIAPLQKAVATPEIIQEIKTSMLTFKRAE